MVSISSVILATHDVDRFVRGDLGAFSDPDGLTWRAASLDVEGAADVPRLV